MWKVNSKLLLSNIVTCSRLDNIYIDYKYHMVWDNYYYALTNLTSSEIYENQFVFFK